MRKLIVMLGIVVLGLGAPSVALAQRSGPQQLHVTFQQVGRSGVGGFVDLRQLRGGGTSIRVVASGLQPGGQYLSLYYDNSSCQLEPYEAEDVIGNYSGNVATFGTTHGTADDDLDEIHSVSVRRASDFTLLACAVVPS